MSEREIARQYIRGLPFPCTNVFTKENIEAALDYKPRDDDIIISTYPKAGTTWVQYIVYEILNGGVPPPSMPEMLKIMPFMENTGLSVVEKLSSPRVIKYHMPYNLIPKNPKTKYIYVIRNPSDVLISYFYFLKQITRVDLVFDDFFETFVSGGCIFGDYFEHILSWYEHRNDENILIISYEKMKKNPRKGLFLIANFIGHDLSGDEELVERILKYTSFEYMKENVPALERDFKDKQNSNSGQKTAIDFFRKGSVGDSKIYFTEEQERRMNNRIEEKLKDSDVKRLWSEV